MTTSDLFTHNRVILTHFDGYSVALVFPRRDKTMLWPQALPEAAFPIPAPADQGPQWSAKAVKQAVVERCGFNAEDLVHVEAFNHWAQTPDGPVRIHLLREVFNLITSAG